MIPESCATFFSSCADKFKNMTWDMFWKMLIGTDTNGCPAVRVMGTLNAELTPATPVQRTLPASTSNAASGNVPAGAKWINFVTSSDWSGNINGSDYPAGFGMMYPPLPNGDTYPSVAWTRTTGTIRVEYLT